MDAFDQSKQFGNDGGIGVRLNAFPGLQVYTRNEDGAVSGLPEKFLVAAPIAGVGLQWRESTGLVTQHKDATMST